MEHQSMRTEDERNTFFQTDRGHELEGESEVVYMHDVGATNQVMNASDVHRHREPLGSDRGNPVNTDTRAWFSFRVLTGRKHL